MPITDIRSYITTGNDFGIHWTNVDTDRVAKSLPELALPDGFALGNLTADIAAVDAAITLDEDHSNIYDLAAEARDNLKTGMRSRLIEFREAVEYRVKGTGYVRALPATPHVNASEQKYLKAMDDMASLWTRLNADTEVANFTPPLILREDYALDDFIGELATLRAHFKAASNAETTARLSRKKRDVLLEPLKDRYVEYRKGIKVEYGEDHPFYQSLPDVYPPSSSSPSPPEPPPEPPPEEPEA